MLAAVELALETGAPSKQMVIAQLKSIKLYGMVHALNALAEQEVRCVGYSLKSAKFIACRDLSGFDFQQSVANEPLVR